MTGCSGFVGQNLSSYLQSTGIDCEGVSLRNSDWKNSLNMNSHAIIHLAGKAHDISNTSLADEYFLINRDLTIKLYNEFLNSDIRDFFFFSSVKAAADTVEGVLNEDGTPIPCTPYGQSKLEAEQYLLKQKLPIGKRLFIIRPCMIHGPGNKGNLNLLYQVVDKGFHWPLASFENKRSFLSIDNLSYLILQMLKNHSLSSGVYNFADDNSLSTNELVKLIASSQGKKAKMLHIPSRLITSLAKIGDIIPFPLNSERLKKLTESYVVSNDKIKEALKIDRLPLTVEEGLFNTIKSFSQKNN